MNRYQVYVIPSAWRDVKNLPGHVRQRVKRAIDALADDPHPPKSKTLNVPELEIELCRLRVGQVAHRLYSHRN